MTGGTTSKCPDSFVLQTRKAVQHIRRMRGGSQSHLMRCDDGELYVVKFLNNPQHPRVLANELLATVLAHVVGLPVASGVLVDVSPRLIESTRELTIHLKDITIPCQSGVQFGSRYVVDPLQGKMFDYFPVNMLGQVRNIETFAGMLAFDKWLGNVDTRQVVFWRRSRQKKYTAGFIDHGYCLNAGEWNFPDHPLRGTYPDNQVYAEVYGWESFEPWLSRVENLEEHRLLTCSAMLPQEWFGTSQELHKVMRELAHRRTLLRDLIAAFRVSERRPFPKWQI